MNDVLQYSIPSVRTKRASKRFISASVAQVFDPLDLIALSLVSVKIIIQ